MTINLLEATMDLNELEGALLRWFNSSRFDIHEIHRRPYPGHGRFKGGGLTLLRIRRKKGSLHFGFAPNANEAPMRTRGWGSREYRPCKVKFLGGLDWIEFNDLLNDFADHHKLNADIGTGQCVLRRGMKRRIGYYASEQTLKWCGRERQIFAWDRVPKARADEQPGFVDGNKCPLLPFSACNSSPGGHYRMFVDRFVPNQT